MLDRDEPTVEQIHDPLTPTSLSLPADVVDGWEDFYARHPDPAPTDAEIDAAYVAEMERRDAEQSTGARIAAHNVQAVERVAALFNDLASHFTVRPMNKPTDNDAA